MKYKGVNASTRRQFVRQVILFTGLFALLDLAASFLFFYTLVPTIPNRPNTGRGVAVVLFSDFGPHGGMDDETMRRLNFTLELFRRENVSHIICSGGARPSKNLYGSSFMKKYLIKSGVMENRIIEENRSNYTFRNLKESKNILQRMEPAWAVVVSSPIHMPRVKHLIARSGARIVFHLSSYDYRNCNPSIAWYTIYLQIQHEFAAFIAGGVLTDRMQAQIFDLIRP
jgi:uncharacterized SAM-binding protein YcdF (DUF218 family)